MVIKLIVERKVIPGSQDEIVDFLRELRSAETKMMAEGRALKLGTNMKFLTHMIILNHTRQSIELQIAEAIAEMPEIEKGREMPMLNRLKDILTLQQAEMEAENAMHKIWSKLGCLQNIHPKAMS